MFRSLSLLLFYSSELCAVPCAILSAREIVEAYVRHRGKFHSVGGGGGSRSLLVSPPMCWYVITKIKSESSDNFWNHPTVYSRD